MHFFAATLVILLPSLAAAVPLIRRADNPDSSCSDRTSKFDGWALANFTFHSCEVFSTPSRHVSWGQVSFDVQNPVLDQTIRCEASSNRPGIFFGDEEYTCPGANGTDVHFKYNQADDAIEIRQSWVCHDDPQWPASWSASGSATIGLNCRDYGVQTNKGWKMGEIYSHHIVNCEKNDVKVAVNEMSGVA